MRLKMNKFIAATSLIEIMMVFFIIGIVSAAAMGLTKPKNEYMKKIAVYAAYRDLSTAVANIKNASYIDFSTDLDVCSSRNANVCNDYVSNTTKQSAFPTRKTVLSLPKVAFRRSYDNTIQDPIFTANLSRNYANLTAGQKKLVKFYQSGLCQRLSSAFNIADMDNSCASSTSARDLLDDSSGYINDFRNQTPSIFLPNGYVYYISKYLYNDFGQLYKRQRVFVQAGEYNDTHTSNESKFASSTANLGPGTSNFAEAYAGISYYNSNSNSNVTIHLPNETKLGFANNVLSSPLANANIKKWATYIQSYYSQNKDYFNVYIDINGKMANSNDTQKGPDMLNQDVFLFHVYRDGSVKPAYDSRFPLNYITAGVNYKVKKADGKQYKITKPQFAMRPVGYAQCMAGIAGDPRYLDKTNGSTYQAHSPHFCDGTTVNSDCYTGNTVDINNPKCGITVNKPSFFIR